MIVVFRVFEVWCLSKELLSDFSFDRRFDFLSTNGLSSSTSKIYVVFYTVELLFLHLAYFSYSFNFHFSSASFAVGGATNYLSFLIEENRGAKSET